MKNRKRVWCWEKLSGCFVVVHVNMAHMINRAGLTYGWMDDCLSLGRKSRVLYLWDPFQESIFNHAFVFAQMKMDERFGPLK